MIDIMPAVSMVQRLARTYTLFVILLCVLPAAYSYDADYEPILYTSPNADAAEYILITHNALEQSLSYLNGLIHQVQQGDEPVLIQNIRVTHLLYLTAFAYVFHVSDTHNKGQRHRLARDTILQSINLGTSVISNRPRYADIRRVVAVSMFLTAKMGLQGFNEFLNYKDKAIQYSKEAIALDHENPMARVVLNNFDSLAPGLVGANKKRGRNAIFIPIQDKWLRFVKSEFYMSQGYSLKQQKKKDALGTVIQKIISLYPKHWRIAELQ